MHRDPYPQEERLSDNKGLSRLFQVLNSALFGFFHRGPNLVASTFSLWSPKQLVVVSLALLPSLGILPLPYAASGNILTSPRVNAWSQFESEVCNVKVALPHRNT